MAGAKSNGATTFFDLMRNGVSTFYWANKYGAVTFYELKVQFGYKIVHFEDETVNHVR